MKSKARPKPFTGTGDDVITMLCWSLMGGQRWSERNSSLAMTQQPFGRRSADLKSWPKLPIFSDAGYAGSSGIICWHHFQFWKSLARWHRRRWRRRGKTVNRRLIVCSVGCCGSWGTVKPLQRSSATLKSDATKSCNKDHEFDHNILSDNENGHGKHPLIQHILTCNDSMTFYCKVPPGSRKARHEESTGTLLR